MYPAKLILFGEYTVLLGGRALAMPLQQFKAYWDRSVLETDTRISGFFEYLLTNDSLKDLFDAAKMKSDLGAGLVFQSDIPLGYGLGSSGALCAATYDTYALTKSTDLHLLKKQLADMEAHFHGASSGTDPLICYLNQTLLLEKNNIKVLSDFSLDR
ncbi:MAG: mevalonate kinase, partial [Bacteroidota bacterium]